MDIRVLIVETDTAYRHNLSGCLQVIKRIKVDQADGYELEYLLETKDFDVAIVGLNQLPRQRLEAVRRIKQKQPQVEVILMVARDQLSASIQAMKEGVFDDILIPFDLETLLQKIRRAAHHQRKKHKIQQGFLARCKTLQDVFAAAAFAEAGEPEEARRLARGSHHRNDKK